MAHPRFNRFSLNQKITTRRQINKDLNKHDFKNEELVKGQGLIESSHPKSICLNCEMLLKQVSSFLKNLEEPDLNEWNSVCDHCRKLKSIYQCKKCYYLANKIKEGEEKCQDSKKWKEIGDILNQVKLFLETLIINKRNEKSSDIASDYEDLVKMLKLMRISSENQVVVEEMSDLEVLKWKNTSGFLENRKQEYIKSSKINLITKKKEKVRKHLSFTELSVKRPLISHINDKNVINKKRTDEINVPTEVKKIKKKSDKVKVQTSSDLFKKMISQKRKNRNRSGITGHVLINSQRVRGLPVAKIDELPALPVRALKEKDSEESGSFLECTELRFSEPKEVIHVNKIITEKTKNNVLRQQHTFNREPLFYDVQHDFVYTNIQQTKETSNIHKENIPDGNNQEQPVQKSSSSKGRIKYELSNKRYIDNGFTVLPTFKIMRRVNVYRMITSLSKFNWLEKCKDRGLMCYSSGEKLAKISEEGQFNWYYRDGSLALNFSKSTDEFLIYDSYDVRKNSDLAENKIMLACFDKMGHGIVYDRKGNTRLKYNQFEGINLDKNIGPTGRWKWNNLNDPPELVQVFEEKSIDEIDNCQKDIGNGKNETPSNIVEQEMHTIELLDYVNQKFKDMYIKYKPYQIRLKVLKLNEHFTLKIFDQTKIYLLFRAGNIYFKLNLGMRVISNEIVDIKTVDLYDVATPYD